MRILAILFWLGYFATQVFAGTSTLLSVSGGKVQTSHVNQYYSAMNQDIVPRNSSGVATDIGGNLGQSALRWGTGYINALQIGANADNLSITDSSTNMVLGSGAGINIQPTGALTLNPTGNIVVESNGTNIFTANSTGITSNLSHWINRSSLPSVGLQTSSSCGGYTTSSASYVNVTNLSVSLTTTGRPVVLAIQPSGVSNMVCNGSTGNQFQLKISGTTSTAPQWTFNCINGSTVLPGQPLFFIDAPAAGAQTYTVQAEVLTATSLAINSMVLVAYEL